MNVIYFNDNSDSNLIDDKIFHILKKIVNTALEVENFPHTVEVSVSFVTNNEIKQLNKQYRSKDYVTDVLSFPMYDNTTQNYQDEILLGDIVISTKKAEEQALEYNHSFNREICYLTAHGMFHLLGYDHMNEDEKKIMRQKEEEVMKTLNLQRMIKGNEKIIK